MIRDVIVRTAGERTADVCIARLIAMLPDAKIHRLEIAPFADAVRECYRIGSLSEGEWFLTCDGDVLPDENLLTFVDRLKMYPDVGMVVATIDDWILDMERPGGVRACHPSVAIKIANNVKVTRRPESLALRRAGVVTMIDETVVGTHDKEQWLRGVYRTTLHHLHKHKRDAPKKRALRKQALRTDHPDFVMVAAALRDRIRYDYMNSNAFPEAPLAEFGLTEKEPLCSDTEKRGG